MSRTVVLLGSLAAELHTLEELACQFGWSLHTINTLSELRQENPAGVAAVIFEPARLDSSWRQALQSVRDIVPEAALIVCHGFAAQLPWPELAEAGAFHSLLIPFDRDEVRQSFGFLQSAHVRSAS
jgi:aminoglycoside phosphotransferase